MSFLQHQYNPQRYRPDHVRIEPPFLSNGKLRMYNVAHAPRIDRNTMFITFLDGSLKSFSMSGKMIWENRLGEKHTLDAHGMTAIPYDGAIIMYDNMLFTRFETTAYLIDPVTGAIQERYEIPEFPVNCAVITESILVSIYFNDPYGDYFYGGYDIRKKEFLWKRPYKFKDSVNYVHAAKNNRIIFAERKDELYCLDARTGNELWRRNMLDIVKTIDPEFEMVSISDTPAIYNDVLIHGIDGILKDRDGHIHVPFVAALELSTGSIRWFQETQNRAWPSTALYPDGTCYLFEPENLFILNADNGKIMHHLFFGDKLKQNDVYVSGEFVVSNEYIFVADIYQAVVIGFHKYTGEVVWRFQAEEGVANYSGLTLIGDNLFVLDIKGNLWAFYSEKYRSLQ